MSDSSVPFSWIIRSAAPADAAGIARVHVDSWRSTYAGIMPAALLEGLTYADREKMWRTRLGRADNPNPLLVAESDSGDIIGFIAGGPEASGRSDFRAEVYAVYLMENAQGQGIGRALFTEAVQRLHALGFDNLLVWVARDNPACGFYEGLGGMLIDEKEEKYGGQAVRLVAYGWQGLDALLA